MYYVLYDGPPPVHPLCYWSAAYVWYKVKARQQASGVDRADPVKATAGFHFMKVRRELGLDLRLGPRLRPLADGQTAMAAMVRDSGPAGQILIG